MSDEILQRFLEEPGGHVVLEAQDDLVIKEAGPHFARMSLIPREDLVGRKLLDVITEREGKSNTAKEIMDSVQRVRDTGEPDKLPVLPIKVNHHGKWELRWWEITNIPIMENGNLKYVVQRVEDQTVIQTTYAAIRIQRRTSYVLYCFVILAVCLGLWRVTAISNEANHTAKQSNRTAKQTNLLTRQSVASTRQYRVLRQQELRDVCNKDDQLVRQLRALIIGSATSSKPFEHVYESLGLPPYAERVRIAEKQAASLKLLNCPSLK